MKGWRYNCLVLVLGCAFVLAGCVRPSITPAPADGNLDFSDPDVGGGIGDNTPQTLTPSPEATAIRDVSPRLEVTLTLPTATTAAPIASATPTVQPPAIVPPTMEPTLIPTTIPTATPTVAPEIAEPPAPVEAAVPAAEGEIVHIVASGENLFRIGLKYGLSWLTLAQHNGIGDPNQLTVGQEIRIPGPATPAPAQPPTGEAPSQTEGAYTVQPGDNLYRIGQAFGVSWVQIAEANGLINPGQIYAGQVLKIPVSRPGPTPTFTHQVRAGETLFRIAVQYGVPLTTLAEANGLRPPFVIYPGQSLTIPGNGSAP